MGMPKVGEMAPDFTLTSDAGETVKLSALRGGPVVLYFYPRDDTSGCTAEACGIRDDYDAYQRAAVTVLGVSPDSVDSHVKFKEKYSLLSHFWPTRTMRSWRPTAPGECARRAWASCGQRS